jgi:Ca2+:H+ antiporter
VREALPVHVWSTNKALAIMGLSMVGIALMSELLVASVEAVTAVLGLTPFFVRIIIVPIIGNVAEHLVFVQAAMVSLDGESNWLEGAMLLAVYGILGLTFFFLPLKL